MEDFIPWYPKVEDENFTELLWSKWEFFELKLVERFMKNNELFLYSHQLFIERFISPETPYQGLLLFHNTGSGKTFSSISVCENHKTIFQKALVLVKGNTSLINFKEQIVKWYKAVGYDTNLIKKYYEIKKYISFSNTLKHLTDEQIKNKFSNRIIIIDEAHNLRYQSKMQHYPSLLETYKKDTNKKNIQSTSLAEVDQSLVYNQIWRLLHLVEKSKVLLLTATPMIDRAEEIQSLLNLILGSDKQLEGELCYKVLETAIRGRVSYLRSNEEMATVSNAGELLPGCSVKIVLSFMKDFQLSSYEKIETRNTDDHVYRNSVYCSLMTLCDGSYGAIAFEKNIKKIHSRKETYKYVFIPEIKRTINRTTLASYSCKYAKMIEIIESEDNSLVFVFCEEVKGSGVIMMGCVFEALGYKFYSGEKIDDNMTKDLRYTFYTGDLSICPNFEERLAGFKSERNKYGEYVKVLIGSKVSGEGVSLSNVRQVHIITPHWNISTIVQAIGRAIRRDSHNMLNKSERNITIYRHAALACSQKMDKDIYDPKISIDMYKYKISEKKAESIKMVEKKLKEYSIDFYLNVDKNTIKDNFGKDISTYLKVFDEYTKNSYTPYLINKFFKKKLFIPIDQLISSIFMPRKLLFVLLERGLYFSDKEKLEIQNENIRRKFIKSIQKITNLDSYCKKINKNYMKNNDSIINLYVDNLIHYISRPYRKQDLVKLIMSFNIELKVKILEFSIERKKYYIINLFRNSVVRLNNKWYHIMLYRGSDNEFSYSVSSESFVLSGKTRVFDTYWKFVERKEEELIVDTILEKSRRFRTSIEMLDIYGIVSTGDGKFRIRNIAFENKERSSTDLRKVNRGRNIDSYSQLDLIKIAIVLFSKQINYNYILSTMDSYYFDENIIKFCLADRNVVFNSEIINNNQMDLLVSSNKYEFGLVIWLMSAKKQELKNIIFSALVNNDMYIII